MDIGLSSRWPRNPQLANPALELTKSLPDTMIYSHQDWEGPAAIARQKGEIIPIAVKGPVSNIQGLFIA